jgi:membrane-bound serine protease (ClpP class)
MQRAGTTRPNLRRLGRGLCFAFAAIIGLSGAIADTGSAGKSASGGSAMLLDIDGAIGPATTDYLTRALDHADERGTSLVILRMDTPGGLTAATRDIVQAIRNSPVPVVVWVAPEGAQAASAGTYILYASHVAAMAPATNVGAATPVSLGDAPSPKAPGPEGKQDEDRNEGSEEGDGVEGESTAPEPAGDAKSRKALNDAAAWIRGLAQETGRNAEWAERAVREAVSITAEEAIAQNVAEIIARDLDELLAALDGRIVDTVTGEVTLATANLRVERVEPDWRSELLSVITNPTVAYLLLMIGIYGLLLEGYNPGSLVPGTVGAICLLLALYALQVLPVNYAGLLLIVLGIILMVSEAFMPSFGVLGIGGVVAMITGSIVLFDTEAPGFDIALEVIGGMGVIASLLTAALIWLAVRAWRNPVVSGDAAILDARGETLEAVDARSGTAYLMSERWQVRCDQPLEPGTPVRVVARDGLILRVEPDLREE